MEERRLDEVESGKVRRERGEKRRCERSAPKRPVKDFDLKRRDVVSKRRKSHLLAKTTTKKQT